MEPRERSFKVKLWRHEVNIRFAYIFWLDWARDMGEAPKCSPHLGASNDMRHDLLKSPRDLPWPWPEVKCLTWPFEVNEHMVRFVSTRQTRWYPYICSIFQNEKVIRGERFRSKTAILTLVTSEGQTLDLRSNLTTCCRCGIQLSFECRFAICSISYSFWDNGSFPKQCSRIAKKLENFAIFGLRRPQFWR